MPLSVHELRVLLAALFRSDLRPSFSARPICWLRLSTCGVPHEPHRLHGLLCLLLTSAFRLGRLTASSVPKLRTERRPPGVSLTAFAAHLPDLQPWPLMDLDFAIRCPLVRPRMPLIRFLFVRSRFCSTLPPDPASRRRPCASLALRLHRTVQRTFTSKLSNMPGTQREYEWVVAAVLPQENRFISTLTRASRRGRSAAQRTATPDARV